MSSRKRKPRKGTTEAISITLPKSLISRVNNVCQDRERSQFIKKAILQYLEVNFVHT